MKIKKIEAILKASKTIIVLEAPSCQWLGDGQAFYPFYNLPPLTAENIFAMFDIPGDKQYKFLFQKQEPPAHISLADNLECDEPLIRDDYSVNDGRCQLEMFITSTGVIFLPQRYLSPFSDEDSFIVYERTNAVNGFTYIVVKRGFDIIGVFNPYIIKDKNFLPKLRKVLALCESKQGDEE